MAPRRIVNTVTGQQVVDDAGIRLVRVLGHDTTDDFDPFFMLDFFDSKNPADYIQGVPTHPYRGIGTIIYSFPGEIERRDSLGNNGAINAGEHRRAGSDSGILHQETPRAAEYMLGFHLRLHLHKKGKLTPPAYYDISKDRIVSVQTDAGLVRVISGEYRGNKGTQPKHLQATIYDVLVKRGKKINIDTRRDETVFVFVIDEGAAIDFLRVSSKTAVLFSSGDNISVKAPEDSNCRFIFCSAKPLKEPVVMNTQQELRQTFDEIK